MSTPIDEPTIPKGSPTQNPLGSTARAILPPSQELQPDQVAQFYRVGVPQVRFAPLQTPAQSAPNANTNTVASTSLVPVRQQIQTNTNSINQLVATTWKGIWDAQITYSYGAIVEVGGVVYTSLSNNNLNNVPASSPTFWGQSGTNTFEGTWSSSTAYVPGNSVVYTDPTTNVTAFYICIANSTNNPPSVSPTFWQVTGSSSTYQFLGAYSNSTPYFPGNQVTYNPSGGGTLYWICIANTTGNAPSQASSFWELVGTSAANLSGLDGVAPSQTGLNLVYNGDFSIATVPSGIQSTTASAIRVQDPQTGSTILQPSANGWTRNFENQNAGEGYCFQYAGAIGVGLQTPFSLNVQDKTTGGNCDFSVVCDAFTVNPSTNYNFSASLFVGLSSGLPANATWFFRVLWYKQGATNFSRGSSDLISLQDIISNSSASGLQNPSATLTAPANAGYCRIAFYHWSTGTVTSAWNLVISNVRCQLTLSGGSGGGITDGPSSFAQTSSSFSYRPTSPANPLSSTGGASTASVSISAFTMSTSSKFGNVSVNSGSITGLSLSTLYYIYYNDPQVAGGSVTFNATTNKATALGAGSNTGQFYVGSIVTPAASGSSIGNSDGGLGVSSGAVASAFATATSLTTGSNVGGNFSATTATSPVLNTWFGFAPSFNDRWAVSRTLSVTYNFTLVAATGSYSISYSSNSASGTLASGTTASGTLTATQSLPASVDLTSLVLTVDLTCTTGTHTSITVSAIQVIEVS